MLHVMGRQQTSGEMTDERETLLLTRRVSPKQSSTSFYILLILLFAFCNEYDIVPSVSALSTPIQRYHRQLHISPSQLHALSSSAASTNSNDRESRDEADKVDNSTLTSSIKSTIMSDQVTANSTLAIQSKAQQEASRLRQQAQKLMEEAEILQQDLDATKRTKSKRQDNVALRMMDLLLRKDASSQQPITPISVAKAIRDERWSTDQALRVIDLLYTKLSQVLYGGYGTSDNATLQENIHTQLRARLDEEVERRMRKLPPPKRKNIASPQPVVVAANTANVNQTELYRIEDCIDCFIKAAEMVDSDSVTPSSIVSNHRWSGRVATSLRARLSELKRTDEIQRSQRLTADISNALIMVNQRNAESSTRNITLEEFIAQNLGIAISNSTTMTTGPAKSLLSSANSTFGSVVWYASWIPSTLIVMLAATNQTLDMQEIKDVKEKVLPGSGFHCTSSVFTPTATIFRGNLRQSNSQAIESSSKNARSGSKNKSRTKEKAIKEDNTGAASKSAVAFAELEKRMNLYGLNEKIQLFLLPDPEWTPKTGLSLKADPVVIALPSSVTPSVTTDTSEKAQTKALDTERAGWLVTVISLFAATARMFSLNLTFFDNIVNLRRIPLLVQQCGPIIVGIVLIQVMHELAHHFIARKRNLRIGRPVPIPVTSWGMFGCLTPLRSFPADRKSLFDFALSGPLTGFVVSVLFMIVGLRLTVRSSAATLQQFPVLPVGILKSSLLTGGLISYLAPKVMMLPHSQPVPLHPLFLSGFSGLISTALNLLPVFRLDGGRLCSAALGTRVSALISTWTVLLAISTVVSGSKLAIPWLIFVFWFYRRPEIPVRNDITEIDKRRFGFWLTSLATAVLALMPFPGTKSMF